MSKRILSFVMSLLLIAGSATGATAQQRQVTGTVTGADQAPVSGATVTITGTRRGVQTDAGGRFTIAVPAGDASLTVSRLGFSSRVVAVPAGQSNVDVRLQSDILNLEALVVTGTATTVRRQNAANAVAVVSREELQRAPAPTIERALQGKVAGAQIVTNSGAPGGGAQFRIRCISTLIGNRSPLYVVDGVIISDAAIAGGQNFVSGAGTRTAISGVQDNVVNRVADLNPADIESVEVLKGASASAVYGSKAANGVIVIRTRGGRAGAPRFSLTQRFGYAEQARTLGSRSWTRDEAEEELHLTAAELNTYFNADGSPKAVYDNEAAVFGRRAPQSETNVSVSGGSEATRYYVSGTVADNEGIAANTGFNRQGLQLRLDQTLGSRLRVGVSANVNHTVAARGLTGNDNNGVSYYAAISFTPNFVNLDGSNGVYPENPFAPSNPVQTAALSTNDENTWRTISSLNVTYDILERAAHRLQFLGNGGVDFFQQRNALFYPAELQFETDDNLPGTAVNTNANNTNVNGNLNLVHTFDPDGGSFRATTSIGVQYEDRDLTTNAVAGRYLIGGIRLPEQGANTTLFGERTRTRDQGFFGQEELLLLDERLTLTGSLRADRSSNNADAGKYYMYPKASASFRLGSVLPRVDDIKLRAAYGSSGNQPLFTQRFAPLFVSNLDGQPGIQVNGTFGASDLRPERTTELEGGVDFTLFNGNARLELTGYNKVVTDFLLSRTLAPSTGFSTQFFNGGELHARGFEALLEATPVRRDNLTWLTRTTFYRNRHEITDLPVPAFRPANSSFGFVYGGYLIQNNESPTAMLGFKDGERVIYGDSEPDFLMGFTNDVTMGRFTLSSLVDWSKGGLVANLTRSYYDDARNAPDYVAPASVPRDEDGNVVPRDFNECGYRCLSGQERAALVGDWSPYIEDGSFVKVREVSLAYDVPSQLLSRAGRVNSARITLAARNPYMWTRYTGLDPEVSNFGNRSVGRNIDVTPFPPSRSFWLGFNVGF